MLSVLFLFKAIGHLSQHNFQCATVYIEKDLLFLDSVEKLPPLSNHSKNVRVFATSCHTCNQAMAVGGIMHNVPT